MYELKIYGGVLCHDNEKQCKNWKGTDLLLHEEFGEYGLEGLKVSKICTLMGSSWPKYMFELKKYRGVKFDSTEDWCNI